MMMTKLTIGRPVIRETQARDRDRPLIVELFPSFVAIHAKQSQEKYNVSWDAIYDLARKLQARGKMS